jgi:hypothetical protein|tara:strand:- start:250 stop:480 length:231 start_codon:yes stop_codon:yes gene_type:complete
LLSEIHVYPISGAASSVGSEETPWAYREASYAGAIVGVNPDPVNTENITKCCKGYWSALHPHSSGGVDSNFMTDPG